MITATVIICTVIAIRINKEDVLTTDGIFPIAGFALGLFITSMNLIERLGIGIREYDMEY